MFSRSCDAQGRGGGYNLVGVGVGMEHICRFILLYDGCFIIMSNARLFISVKV
jgi:hypothetical protein